MLKSLASKWSEASATRKFILVNMVIPWIPIFMLCTAYFAPPEVVEMLNENGKLMGLMAGESWKLASFFFAKFLGF